MLNILEDIKIKINKELKPEKIFLINNSKLHTNHKSFNPKKYHLKLIIESAKLRNMERINAHKIIFSLLQNEMKNHIHALEIEIR
jgi:stress-induced morphogen